MTDYHTGANQCGPTDRSTADPATGRDTSDSPSGDTDKTQIGSGDSSRDQGRQREDTDGLRADGGTQGAVDHDYDDAVQDARRAIQQGIAERRGRARDELQPGDVAIDLVKRQPLFVTDRVAEDCVAYYEQEQFDLVNYKMHPYIGVTADDAVFECVFIGGIEGLHRFSDTYDYPESRLARVPIEIAGGDSA